MLIVQRIILKYLYQLPGSQDNFVLTCWKHGTVMLYLLLSMEVICP